MDEKTDVIDVFSNEVGQGIGIPYSPPIHIDSIKNLPRHEINPFVYDLTIKRKPRYKKINDIEKVNSEKNIVLAEELFRDKDPFVRIFHMNSRVDIRKLSANACKIIFFILWDKMTFNVDYVIVNPTEVSNELEMGNMTSVYSAIIELVKAGILAGHTEKNIYWVNPQFMYCGNRTTIKIK